MNSKIDLSLCRDFRAQISSLHVIWILNLFCVIIRSCIAYIHPIYSCANGHIKSMNDNVNYLRKLLDNWLTSFTKSAVFLQSDNCEDSCE